MSPLAAQEIALRRDRAYATLAQSHVHRATREDSLGVIKGRDTITATWVCEDAADIEIMADLGDMIAYQVTEPSGKSWAGHRWICREEGKITRETVVENRAVSRVAPPAHAPVGELRAGTGQYDAGPTATVPADFPTDARAMADRLHQAWNGRAFNLYDQAWLPELVRALPDAIFSFERAIVSEGKTAILWRVHGHHASGRRIRLIGSSIFTGDHEDTLFDAAAMAAQIDQPVIDYGLG